VWPKTATASSGATPRGSRLGCDDPSGASSWARDLAVIAVVVFDLGAQGLLNAFAAPAGAPVSSLLEVSAPRGPVRVGNLTPLTGALGEELWGGYKSLNFSAWGGDTKNMVWDRFLGRVASASWADPEHVQLLLKDDGDSHFRRYMFVGGELRNVAPAPDDGGYDRLW
jgi:hypothetical protein